MFANLFIKKSFLRILSKFSKRRRMKIFKAANKVKVTREMISKFGEAVYRTPDVEKVFIKVSFACIVNII